MRKIGTKIDEVRIDGNLNRLREDLKHYAKIGIEAVELPVHGLDAIKNGSLDKHRLRAVKEIIRDYNFLYSVHSPNPLNLMDKVDRALHISVFNASLEFASDVGAKALVYHPGRYIPEETFPIYGKNDLSEDEKQELLLTEAEIISRLSDEWTKVTICMENARPYLFHSPYCYAERLESLKEQVLRINKDNVKINLDFGHLYMASKFYGFKPAEAVNEIKNLIAHTHIHDNYGNAVYSHEKQQTHQIPFGKGDSHMPVGWGEIPFGEILSTFVDSYQGLWMMELRNRYFEQIEDSRNNLVEILTAFSPLS
jgi:sugar phosphate isomerase/epimerase